MPINYMHEQLLAEHEASGDAAALADAPPPFDTVRGMFQEGEAAFPGSGVRAWTHTQVAVISQACIKGYFRPRPYPVL